MNSLIIFCICCVFMLFYLLVCMYVEKYPKSKLNKILKKIDDVYYEVEKTEKNEYNRKIKK